jgi:hypothetical protein
MRAAISTPSVGTHAPEQGSRTFHATGGKRRYSTP